ncbi:glycosyltransferase, partial [Candidatus Neomarinimicrobiota bacterium]
LKTIGFLGNISIKKGIKIFFDILDKLNHNNAVKGIIGGPFQDNKSKIFTINEVKKYSYISYLGPLYFKKKEEFFNSIDVLLMPSILEEAEPLVIHEGMSHGIPVIAYDKGCIKEIIRNDNGLVVDLNQNFIKHAVNLLNGWIDDPNLFNEIRANALHGYIKTKEMSKISLENILSQITNNLND